MRLDHPIFQGPLPVELELAEIETPAHYRDWPGGAGLPARLPVWRVQAADLSPIVSRGTIADPYGFEDSPDAEWISSGINSKSYRSLALGRHGNFFYWGFSADPAHMTASGRTVFLNVLVYMRGFQGARPLVRREARSREWAGIYVSYVRRAQQGEGVADSSQLGALRKYFPDAVLSRLGVEAAPLAEYYQQNLEYLQPAERGFGFVADPDLAALQVSNRRPELLERLATLLEERGPDDAVVLRLFRQYLPAEAPRSAAGYAAWLERNRARLFFSDVGGFRWFLAPP
ncbi:MAG: hypothetical protein EYC70_07300 [Planctomycetota bacterium]|nr:MAG: hypothetical protein EYC70_07300 [Planctomycetota bacterium]